jgi:hypothetical protein
MSHELSRVSGDQIDSVESYRSQRYLARRPRARRSRIGLRPFFDWSTNSGRSLCGTGDLRGHDSDFAIASRLREKMKVFFFKALDALK